MLAYIKGVVEYISDSSVIIDNGGIGYSIGVSPATVGRLPQRGTEIQLFTYMQVKEDGVSLYGFLSREEVRMFTLLISVSGVGPKAAASVLSALTPEQIMLAIVADDAAAFSKAPGVGRKTAQRLILELRDKIKTGEAVAGAANASGGAAFPDMPSEKQDALDALQALGYSRSESLRAVLECAEDGMKAEQIVKLALKALLRQK